jgi:hypothetical protein
MTYDAGLLKVFKIFFYFLMGLQDGNATAQTFINSPFSG